MAIDKKRVEEFEKIYKETLFSKISEARTKQFESINLMTTNARNIGQSNVNIPNASTTLNNKIVELSQVFKNAGISMFSSKLEDFDVVSSSFLGDAIIEELMGQLSKSSEKLDEYSKTIERVSKKKSEQMKAIQNVNPIRKFFSRIRVLFVPVKPVDFSITEEEQNILDTRLQEYTDIDNKIWNYNLEENLVPAIVKEITRPQKFGKFDIPHRYNAYTVPDLLEESVIPDLKKLGLEHLIPQLQEALIEEYKKDLPDPEIYQVSQEDMYLYVPNFNRENIENGKSKEIINSTNGNLRKNGISIEDFALIDKSVSASNRQATTNAIQDELHPVKENNQEKTEEITDISLE